MLYRLKISALVIAAFIFGASINMALCETKPCEGIAIVDMTRILKNCKEFNNLKNDQQARVKELQNFMLKAQQDVAAQTDDAKRKSLQEKYNIEYKTKKADIENSYIERLSAIDSKIASKIQEKAKNMGYSLVLTKNCALYGGEDITNVIEQTLK